MTDVYDLPAQPLQCYLTAAYPCSYLEDQEARSQVITPGPQIDALLYSRLIDVGFRRSGLFVYRPYCQACRACLPVRMDVHHFTPNRSQRRAWRLRDELEIRELPLQFDDRHHQLYQRYQLARHPSTQGETHSAEQYRQFLLSSPLPTQLIEFRHQQRLVMVSLIDPLPQGLSSVYTFYDPDLAHLSLGTLNILWQWQECQRLNLPWLYLGYWIRDSAKMSYKSRFQPLQAWFQGAWVPFETLHPTPPSFYHR